MEFVTFEIAVKLKEKGFMEECLCHYIGNDLFYNIESPIANKQLWFSHNKFDNIWHRDNYDAPTISQVLKWLREKSIIITIIYTEYSLQTINLQMMFGFNIQNIQGDLLGENTEVAYCSYEQAAIEGIEYVLNNLI